MGHIDHGQRPRFPRDVRHGGYFVRFGRTFCGKRGRTGPSPGLPAITRPVRRMDFPIERDPAEAWPRFVGGAPTSERAVYTIAATVDVVPSLWSGPRRHETAPIPPLRPVPGSRTRRPSVSALPLVRQRPARSARSAGCIEPGSSGSRARQAVRSRPSPSRPPAPRPGGGHREAASGREAATGRRQPRRQPPGGARPPRGSCRGRPPSPRPAGPSPRSPGPSPGRRTSAGPRPRRSGAAPGPAARDQPG